MSFRSDVRDVIQLGVCAHYGIEIINDWIEDTRVVAQSIVRGETVPVCEGPEYFSAILDAERAAEWRF